MSNRWTDAAMSLYIFDDQHEKGRHAEETQDTFRGQLLHLMSLLHCFACLVRPRLLSSLLGVVRSQLVCAASNAQRRGRSG